MIDYRRMIDEAAEEDYAKFSSKLIPGKEGIKGVRIPALRKIAKQIAQDDWEAFLEDVPECFEEEILRALVIATAPMEAERRMGYSESFIDTIDNWSVSDTFCTSWKFKKKESEAVYDYFSSMMDSGSEFRMRVSVILRMDHFLDEAHVGDLLDDIARYRNDGYYYKMGAAWAASFCFVHFPDRTWETLRSGRMDRWVLDKTIQKICESYRVSDEDKAALREFKKQQRRQLIQQR